MPLGSSNHAVVYRYSIDVSDVIPIGIGKDGNPTALFAKWEAKTDKLVKDFTKVFSEAWKSTPEQKRWLEKAVSSGLSIPSLYLEKTDKVYFLHGDSYLRCTLATQSVDEGFPKAISSYWPGLKAAGFDRGIDAALWWDEKTAYLFKGLEYVRYNLETDKVDEGFPKSIASYWPGFKEAGFGSGIDAIVRWDDEWAYAFKGDKYIRFHIPTNKVDQAPKKTTDYWKALAEVGSQRVLAIF
ncbi:hemopexin repeat-containing protein [Streptomyces sp. NPDC048255]|uniref:hemopexin repeat-containing protein n=1 Tax=Streptomyces sp. NPDC048255 TaxID=3154713 RepID=UPI0033F44DF1